MRKALLNKNKICFIDGSLPKPYRFDPTFEAWEKCNNLVHTWIMNSVSPNIAHNILYIESAFTAWNRLKNRFSQVDSVRIVDLQLEVYLLRQESLSITDFVTQLTVLWEELENLSPVPQCTCPVKCTCDLSRYIETSTDRDFIMRFLTGLNENFAPCKSQILMMDPIPSIDHAFSIVIQCERQNRLLRDGDEEQVLVNAVEGRKPYGRGRGNYSNKVCTHCGKIGHTVETCYRNIGYPLGFKFRNNSTANCATSTDEGDNKSEDSKFVKEHGGAALTQEEYKALISLLHSNKITSESQGGPTTSQACSIVRTSQDEGISVTCCSVEGNFNDWIIDSGASDHICSSLKWFHTYKQVSVA